MSNSKGVFIAFEGIDGCGKSTQATLLADKLESKGFDVLLTREPGGTQIGNQLRSLLLNDNQNMSWETEVLLMAADRAQHVAEVIRPALQRGAIVISDRYVYSSLAYQGYGAGQSVATVKQVNDLAVQGVWPDLTILLMLEPEYRYGRDGEADRIEQRGLVYQRRVFEGFKQLAQSQANISAIDVAGHNKNQVAAMIWQVCLASLTQLRERIEGESSI